MYDDYDQQHEQFEYRELRESLHTARTVKACGFCGGAINPGERYLRRPFVFEGEISVGYQHHPPAKCKFDEGDAPF